MGGWGGMDTAWSRVPGLPPDKCLTQQKPGRLIRAQRQPGYITTNTIGDYMRNSDRSFIISRCRTDQVRNSFFTETATDWNHLDNTTVHAASFQRFKALVTATQHQQALVTTTQHQQALVTTTQHQQALVTTTQHQQAAKAQFLLRCTQPDYWLKQRAFQNQHTLTFSWHLLSPLAVFTSGVWQWIHRIYSAKFKGIFEGRGSHSVSEIYTVNTLECHSIQDSVAKWSPLLKMSRQTPLDGCHVVWGRNDTPTSLPVRQGHPWRGRHQLKPD